MAVHTFELNTEELSVDKQREVLETMDRRYAKTVNLGLHNFDIRWKLGRGNTLYVDGIGVVVERCRYGNNVSFAYGSSFWISPMPNTGVKNFIMNRAWEIWKASDIAAKCSILIGNCGFSRRVQFRAEEDNPFIAVDGTSVMNLAVPESILYRLAADSLFSQDRWNTGISHGLFRFWEEIWSGGYKTLNADTCICIGPVKLSQIYYRLSNPTARFHVNKSVITIKDSHSRNRAPQVMRDNQPVSEDVAEKLLSIVSMCDRQGD